MGDEVIVGGAGIAVGAWLVGFAFAASVATIVDDEGIDAEIAKHGEFVEPVGDVARVAVEEEDGTFGATTDGQEPAVDAEVVGGGEGDVFVLEAELVGGLVDLAVGVIDHARLVPAQPEGEGDDQSQQRNGDHFQVPHLGRGHIAYGKSVDEVFPLDPRGAAC